VNREESARWFIPKTNYSLKGGKIMLRKVAFVVIAIVASFCIVSFFNYAYAGKGNGSAAGNSGQGIGHGGHGGGNNGNGVGGVDGGNQGNDGTNGNAGGSHGGGNGNSGGGNSGGGNIGAGPTGGNSGGNAGSIGTGNSGNGDGGVGIDYQDLYAVTGVTPKCSFVEWFRNDFECPDPDSKVAKK
jgi:hypothetical protein